MAGLFDGSAIPLQPTGTDSSTAGPLWQQQYVYNLANAATNLAGTPYPDNVPNLTLTPSGTTQQAWQSAQNNVGAWKPDVNQAESLTSGAANPLDVNQATGYEGALNSAIQGGMAGYENPYNQQVVGALQQAMNTNFNTNIMPSVYDRYVQSGQSGSPQEMQMANNAMYQEQQAEGQAIAPVLQQGFNTALAASQGTAGQGLGVAAQNKATQLAAGAQMGQLGGLTSSLGAMDTGTLAAAGQAQDAITAQNANTNYNQFWNQQNYPYLNLGFASNIIRGQAVPQNTQLSSSGTSPATYTASPLASFAQGVAGSQALSGALAKGGRVRRKRSKIREAA